ncbi:MAG: 5-(carboxyamino)imidazole ribonucleotide synthase [Thermoplasmatota archaeon]
MTTVTLGILGGGQLGRMIAVEARKMGHKVAIMDASADCPARGCADHFVHGALDDADAVARMNELSDVLTLETEHVPAELLERIEKPLRPNAKVFWHIQDRLRQRELLASLGIPQPVWAPVGNPDEARAAFAQTGPGILKSRRGGYDGKGQIRLKEGDDPAAAYEQMGAPAVMERFVPFDDEVSILVARGLDGATATYPIAHNEHRGGILHITTAPTPLPAPLLAEAERIAATIAEGLDHIGVLCVELFVVGDQLLVNEVAPRVHNSGHYTYGACITNQFEQHARAVLGLPLGDTTQLAPAAMLNILGDAWKDGEPDWSPVLAAPGTTLHLYGKSEARPGRKMGHVIVVDQDLSAARRRAEQLHADLVSSAKPS